MEGKKQTMLVIYRCFLLGQFRVLLSSWVAMEMFGHLATQTGKDASSDATVSKNP